MASMKTKNRRKFIIKRTPLLNRSGGAIVILDYFTDTNGVFLEAHTPNISPAAWSVSSNGKYEIQNNECKINTIGGYWAWMDSGIYDAKITANIRLVNSTNYGYHITRFRQQDTSNLWQVGLSAGDGIADIIRITEIVAGGSTHRAELLLDPEPDPESQVSITITYKGANISAQVLGYTPISYNLAATFLTETTIGFYLRAYNTVSAYPTIDDFQLVTV